jgi:hypothetical protein
MSGTDGRAGLRLLIFRSCADVLAPTKQRTGQGAEYACLFACLEFPSVSCPCQCPSCIPAPASIHCMWSPQLYSLLSLMPLLHMQVTQCSQLCRDLGFSKTAHWSHHNKVRKESHQLTERYVALLARAAVSGKLAPPVEAAELG